MSTESENLDGSGELEPHLGQARRTSDLAHGVVIKFKEMGIPESLDGELASLSTDLGDLYSAQESMAIRLDALLRSSDDWGTVGDFLVDLRAGIDHMAWHLKSVRQPLNRITHFAYRKAQESEARE